MQSQFLDMKRIFGLLLLLPFFALAQKDITHTVGPKESLTSIGRLYNINGRELANYNKIEYEKGLTLGQVLKIPGKNAATKTATVPPPAKTVVSKTEKGKPIYHKVGKKETLYHISTLYNKVPIDDIKKWNNLTSDALSEGANIIVGYTGAKNEKPAKEEIVEIPKPKKEETRPQKNIEEIKTPAVVKEVKNESAVPVKAVNFNGGIFRSLYESQTSNNNLVTEIGTGGVFKSTSGWEDGKYYCLHNTAPAGTVIKITNAKM